jgi:hypothetical protein
MTVDGIGLLCACVNNLAGCVLPTTALPHRQHRSICILFTCALLSSLARRRAEPPKAFITTHFSEVLDEELVPRCAALQFNTMNILATVHHHADKAAAPAAQPVGGGGNEDGGATRAAAAPDNIVFLYRLVPGHVAPSYGIHCARMAGVPASVLERAADILDATARGQPLRATRHDPRLAARNARCLRMVQALLDFDVDAGDVGAFLEEVRRLAAPPPGADDDDEADTQAAESSPEEAAARGDAGYEGDAGGEPGADAPETAANDDAEQQETSAGTTASA